MNPAKPLESQLSNPFFFDLLSDDIGNLSGWEQLVAYNKIKESYDKGFEEGYHAKSKADRFYLKHNLEFALKNAVKYSDHLKSKFSIQISEMFLKICTLEEFSILITISPEVYFSEKMDLVYEELHTYLSAINDKDRSIDIVFTFDSGAINRDKLTSNGFILQYRKDPARGT